MWARTERSLLAHMGLGGSLHGIRMRVPAIIPVTVAVPTGERMRRNMYVRKLYIHFVRCSIDRPESKRYVQRVILLQS